MKDMGVTPESLKTFVSGLQIASQKVAKSAIVGAAPFFSWPIISQLTDLAINKICEIIFKQIQTQQEFIFIEQKTARELLEYVENIKRLHQPDASDADYEKARKSLRDLISWHGSGSN